MFVDFLTISVTFADFEKKRREQRTKNGREEREDETSGNDFYGCPWISTDFLGFPMIFADVYGC